jgi:hypothetical protein
LTVIVDNYDARGRRGYNGDLSVVRSGRRARCDGHAVQFSRSGEGATGGTPRLVSQNSAVRAGRRSNRPPDSVDVLDAPRRPEGLEAGSLLRAP